MTTSGADFDPNATYQFLQPYSNSRTSAAWTTANIDTTQTPAYVGSITTASDVSYSPSVTSFYTTTSASTVSSDFSAVPRRPPSATTAPSRGSAGGTMFPANPAPVGAGYGGSYQLWCEFRDIQQCDATFRGDDEAGWIQHHIRHLKGKFPSQLVCWFCDDHTPFKEKHFADRQEMFETRMAHIREHIRSDYYELNRMRPDFHLLEHMCRHGRIDRETFEELREYNELPSKFQLPKDEYDTSFTPADSSQVYYHNQAQEDRRRRREKSSNKKRNK